MATHSAMWMRSSVQQVCQPTQHALTLQTKSLNLSPSKPHLTFIVYGLMHMFYMLVCTLDALRIYEQVVVMVQLTKNEPEKYLRSHGVLAAPRISLAPLLLISLGFWSWDYGHARHEYIPPHTL